MGRLAFEAPGQVGVAVGGMKIGQSLSCQRLDVVQVEVPDGPGLASMYGWANGTM